MHLEIRRGEVSFHADFESNLNPIKIYPRSHLLFGCFGNRSPGVLIAGLIIPVYLSNLTVDGTDTWL